MQELDDAALLREYVERDSEEAFAMLVARHIHKVYSVALRHTGNPHQAEEITQAAFVILARKSHSLGKRVVLSGWLYQTARLAAVTFLRSEIRRTHREQEAQMQTTQNNEGGADVWTQIAPLLDAAMGGLNKVERYAVVLRFFDGKSMKEVGAALGGSEGAAKMRVNRAVGKLQKFFLKRGVTSTTEAMTGAISANTVRAAPTTLIESVTTVALAKGATASVSTLTLVKGALKIMSWTKAKAAIVTSMVILAAAGSTTVAIHHFSQKRAPSPKPVEDLIAQLRQKPGGEFTLEAVEYLVKLKHQGRLPGLPEDGHMSPIMIENWFQDNHGVWHFSRTNGETYPVSRTIRASKDNDGHWAYFYTVVKAAKTSSWQLQKAWRIDTNGKVVEVYSVP